MPTFNDVARKAGVSIATVSRYFNKGYVSDNNKEKISKAINELDYKINTIAQALMRKSSRTIGLILPSITNQFFPELAKAVEFETYKAEYKLLICNSEGSPEKEAEFIATLKSAHADGIITATGNCADIYVKEGIPVVSIDRNLEGSFIHVTSDNKKGGILAVQHLYKKGCKNIVFVRPPLTFVSLRERNEGFLEETKKYLDNKSKIIEIYSDDSQPLSMDIYEKIIDCDGIFAWNDMTAIKLMKLMHIKGIKVPDNKMLIGFDDIYISNEFIPSITTIRQKIYDMGSISTKELISVIESNYSEEKIITLDVELVERETTNK